MKEIFNRETLKDDKTEAYADCDGELIASNNTHRNHKNKNAMVVDKPNAIIGLFDLLRSLFK